MASRTKARTPAGKFRLGQPLDVIVHPRQQQQDTGAMMRPGDRNDFTEDRAVVNPAWRVVISSPRKDVPSLLFDGDFFHVRTRKS
jgi:hypothetical protein